jgi:SAM-dependent methyltransferase
VDRFSWSQAKQYWESQRVRAGSLDEANDPDALGNVCHAGAPLWLNQYYARYQRQVYEHLLASCEPVATGARALDVGCGAGRWCRLLGARGYAVTGIDLQESLIERNRRRYPEMSFLCLPVQDFQPEAPFDLVTSVTVIQHIPFDEQLRAIAKISSLVRTGGHALLLENVHDQGAHVFARSIDGWKRCFEDTGFETVAIERYDYSPTIRASGFLVAEGASLARRLGVLKKNEGPEVPHGEAATIDAGPPSIAERLRQVGRSAGWMARRLAVAIDDRIEPALIRQKISVSTVHCGFLFRKTAA